MYRRAPPLDWIRVFAAAARTESFTIASEELSVTSGAISHRIRSLEEFLGITLFVRKASGVELTDAGRRFAALVQPAVAQIEMATAEILQRPQDQPVRITVMPSFADLWLVPRLPGFYERCANASIELSADSAVLELKAMGFDIGIRRGDGNYPSMEVFSLFGESIFPVAAPQFLAEHPLDSPQALQNVSIIRDVNWKSDWETWLKAAGLHFISFSHYLDFSTYTQAIDAALRGRGVVMAHDALIQEQLADRTLVAPFDLRVAAKEQYFAVTPESVGQEPGVRAFLEWLFAEARLARRHRNLA